MRCKLGPGVIPDVEPWEAEAHRPGLQPTPSSHACYKDKGTFARNS